MKIDIFRKNAFIYKFYGKKYKIDEYENKSGLYILIKNKDYGRYAEGDSTLVVCFTGSNHTTGGNSGSPVINGNGELIGINFDRSWESTMSDVMFSEKLCRNITVDIRYVLFVIDKYAGASHLIDEMKLVETPKLKLNPTGNIGGLEIPSRNSGVLNSLKKQLEINE